MSRGDVQRRRGGVGEGRRERYRYYTVLYQYWYSTGGCIDVRRLGIVEVVVFVSSESG